MSNPFLILLSSRPVLVYSLHETVSFAVFFHMIAALCIVILSDHIWINPSVKHFCGHYRFSILTLRKNTATVFVGAFFSEVHKEPVHPAGCKPCPSSTHCQKRFPVHYILHKPPDPPPLFFPAKSLQIIQCRNKIFFP